MQALDSAPAPSVAGSGGTTNPSLYASRRGSHAGLDGLAVYDDDDDDVPYEDPEERAAREAYEEREKARTE